MRERIEAWLDGQRPAMEAFLETLVNIDSNTYDKAGTDRVGDAITAFLAVDGIAVERLPVEGFGDVLRATIPAPTNGKPVLLLGHRDTVFPTGTVARRPYTRDGDLAFGPGVADMKGGLVLTCFVLRAMTRVGPPTVPIIALFTGDEEIGSATGRPFLEAEAREARAVLNMEPGRVNGNVVTARKGGATLRIEMRGKAAHAGVNHPEGASAILALAGKIVELEALTDYASGVTVNVGTIEGGVSSNTVPPVAVAEVDIRFVDLAQMDRVLADVGAIVAARDRPGTNATLERRSLFLPMEARWSDELMATYKGIAAALGFEVAGEYTGGCSDAGFTASLGVPSLCGLGPIGGKAHTDEEFCRLDSLVPRAKALAGTILALGV